jgi:tetratricopeptide (TPR) repeat protein
LGVVLARQRRFQEAAAEFRQLLQMLESLLLERPNDKELLADMATDFRNLGLTCDEGDLHREAEEAYRSAISWFDRLLADAPADRKHRADKATALTNLANLLRGDEDRQQDVKQLYQSTLELRRRLAAEFPDEPRFAGELAYSCHTLARFLADSPDPRLRNVKLAVQLAEEAVQGYEHPDHAYEYWQTLALAHYRAGDWDQASGALRQSLARKGGYNATNTLLRAMIDWQRGERSRARESYLEATQLEDRSPRLQREAATLMGVAEVGN